MTKTFLKKALVVGSSSAIALSSLMAAAPAFAAAHAVGTNVSSNGTVYFIDPSGSKRPYTSAGAFLSYGFNSWSNVVAASAEDLALPTGSFVPPMDGSLINDHGTVWLVTNGMRAGFTSAANFLGLGYSFSNALPGDTSWMTSTANVDTTAQSHRAGTLVNSNGTVYLMSDSGKMGIPSLSVFNSWGYSFSKVVLANSYDNALPMSGGVMQARVAGQLSPLGSTVVIPPVTGNLSVSAASDMPASGTVVAGQAQADLGHFTFYGTGSVTSVSLKRLGVSADATLSNVYLFDSNGTRLTDAAAVSAGSMVNFNNSNGLFTVNGSRTVIVKSDILSGSQGQTVGVQLTSAMSGSAAVSGTPVSGNLQTIATATLSGVQFGSSVTTSGNSDPGNDVLVWQNTVTVSTRDALMTRLSLRQIGSINANDIRNFKLYVDGALVATTASIDANGYVTFNFSKALLTGSRVLKVTADVVGGSGRTVSMSLRGAYDVTVVDTQYNANILATTSGTFPLTGAAFTVNAGSITTVKATNSASSNLVASGSDVSLGTWTLTAYGEPVKIDTLTAGFTFNGAPGATNDAAATLRNGRLLINGVQVGSTSTVAPAGTAFTVNSTVNPGSPATVEFRADIFDNDGTGVIDAGDTIKATLKQGSANGTPQVSLTPVNVPSSDTDANTLTVASGSLTVAKDSTYADRNVVVPQQTPFKLADFNISNGNTEDVNINTFTLTYTAAGGGTFTAADLSDVYIVYGGQTTSIKPTLGGTSDAFSVTYTLPKNTTIPVEVFGKIGSSIVASATLRLNLAVTATSASGQNADVGATSGQVLTAQTSGTITASLDASSPVSAIVADNQTVTTGAWKLATVDDSYTVTDVTIGIADATTVQTVTLKDGAGNVIASKPGATSVVFNGLSIPAGANANTVLKVDLTLGTVGVGAGSTGADITTSLTTATARSSNGTSATVSGSLPVAANNMYVYAAIPTVNSAALSSTILTNGTVPVARFTVSSNGGTIAWKQVKLNVSKTGGAADASGTDPVLSTFTLWDIDSGTQVTAASVITSTDGDAGGTDTTANCGEIDTACSVLLSIGTNASDGVEHQVSGTRTYEIRATVTGTLATGDNVVAQINRVSSHPTSNAYTSIANGTATFVWSDVSASAHGTGTSDWSNDNLVKNLPITWTLTK